MFAAITFIFVLTVSILINRVATMVLTHTGLSRQSAKFQARSAFTGVGFTTSESEKVVNHPVRRKILLILMLMGNAGIVTAMSSLILAFVNSGSFDETWIRFGILATGLLILWLLIRSKWVDRKLNQIIDRALRKHTKLDVRDFESLFHLAGDYQILELLVQEIDWISEKNLKELRLNDEGIIILGIMRRDGTYLGAPNGETIIHAGDTLIIYGRVSTVENLDIRPKGVRGDLEHQAAVQEHQHEVVEEEKTDPERD